MRGYSTVTVLASIIVARVIPQPGHLMPKNRGIGYGTIVSRLS